MNDPDHWHTSDGFDYDAKFADIVTHLNDDAAGDDPAAHSPAEDAATDSEATDAATDREAPGDQQALPTPQVWRAHEVDDEYEEHFEPLPIAPLPVGDLQFWAIIVGMGGGPLLLLYLAFFNSDASSYWMLTAIAISVGGFALLVSRLPGHHEDDDGARL